MNTTLPHYLNSTSPPLRTPTRQQWANVEKADKSAIHEQKLKCVYLPAEDGVATNGIPEEAEDAGDKSRMDESVSVVVGSRVGCGFGQAWCQPDWGWLC